MLKNIRLVNPFKSNSRQRKAQSRVRDYTRTDTGQFQSVEVVQSAIQVDSRNDCSAFAAQKGQRYLSSEAPSLPLNGCDKQKCTCKYKYFGDRRSDDRRISRGIAHLQYLGNENRFLEDRRG